MTRQMLRLRSWYLLLALAAIILAVAVVWQPIDGIQGEVRALFEGEDTEWAASYTDRGFRTAEVWMTRQQIHALLGPPLETLQIDEHISVDSWTRSPSDSNYRERAFVFDGDMATTKVANFCHWKG